MCWTPRRNVATRSPRRNSRSPGRPCHSRGLSWNKESDPCSARPWRMKECLVRVVTLLAALVASLPAAAPPKPQRFDGLGKHSRVVTKHAEAQAFFDQGLAFLYAFNHDEAIRSFAHSAALDPDCAMAHWGVALANGSHINKPQ